MQQNRQGGGEKAVNELVMDATLTAGQERRSFCSLHRLYSLIGALHIPPSSYKTFLIPVSSVLLEKHSSAYLFNHFYARLVPFLCSASFQRAGRCRCLGTLRLLFSLCCSRKALLAFRPTGTIIMGRLQDGKSDDLQELLCFQFI